MNEKMKKILAGMGVLAAFGLGGSAIAGAQNGSSAEKPAAQSEAGEKGEANETGEKGEANETEQKVTGADADRAGKAALKSVGGGKVVSVEKETPEAAAEKPEAGEKPDSAKERAIDQKVAYSAEVQTSDGKTVDVSLDDAFNVLGSEQDSEDSNEQAGESPSQR